MRRERAGNAHVLAAQCAQEGTDHPDYLLRLAELELIDRHQRMVARRIRAARFPAVKSLDTFDFLDIPSVNKALVMELALCEYIEQRENGIAVGNSGTRKTHVALGLGLAACQRGMSVGFITGAELLLEVFSQRYKRGSVLVTTNLPFDEWSDVFDSERLTHHVHILEMNGDSCHLTQGQPAGRRSKVSRLPISRPAPTRTAPPYLRPLPAVGHFPCAISVDIYAGQLRQAVNVQEH